MKKILFLAVSMLVLGGAKVGAAPSPVVIEPQTVVSKDFLGFGVNWCPYPWFDISEQAWNDCFKRLDYMRPPVARIVHRAFYYCDGFDAAGKPVYNWNSPRMLKLYRMLDYCEKRGIKVILGEWESPQGNNERSDIADDKLQPYHILENDPRWHRLIADGLEYLLNTKHYTCVRYYNLVNEPNGGWSGIGEFGKWQAAVGGFHAELQKRGLLGKISIVGPDACQLEDSYWLDFTVRKCAGQIGLYDLHLYAKKSDVESGALETFYRAKRFFINRFDWQGSKKPFLITEAGMERTGVCEPQGGEDSQFNTYQPSYGIWMADYDIQCARAGMQGVLMWSVDDAEHIMNGDKGWPDIHKVLFKKWGLWNSLGNEIGHPEDTKIRPWFYTWSLMSRYFPAGCQIVKSSETGIAGVRSLAATLGEKEISIALVNDSDTAQLLRVVVPVWKAGVKLNRYHYSRDDRPVNADGFPTPKQTLSVVDLRSGLAVDLPARSFALLTTLPE